MTAIERGVTRRKTMQSPVSYDNITKSVSGGKTMLAT
jgi:hypothetical protein